MGLVKTGANLSMFCGWLERTLYKSGVMLEESDMPDLAINCYVAHTNKTFAILRHHSNQGNERRLDYERLYKLLGKLGKHIWLFKRMIHAIDALRRDFREGFLVKPISASTGKPSSFPNLNEKSMKKVVVRVFNKEHERDEFYHHLSRFYDKDKLSGRLQQCKKAGLRVHAEILLIDYFDRTDVTFLNNDDKYIGCSKPACYLCYHYIRKHPANYTLPSTHQKLYYAWCLPTVRANDRNCTDKIARHKRFLTEITANLRSDLRNEVMRQVAPRNYHADSTAGASSITGTGRADATQKISDHRMGTLIRLLDEGKASFVICFFLFVLI